MQYSHCAGAPPPCCCNGNFIENVWALLFIHFGVVLISNKSKERKCTRLINRKTENGNMDPLFLVQWKISDLAGVSDAQLEWNNFKSNNVIGAYTS